jgi:hypothetical protein
MYCTNCGSKFVDDANFCHKCGQAKKSTSPSSANVDGGIMQKWDYKIIYRLRGGNSPISGGAATAWNQDVELPQLGAQGWELVVIVPRSGIAGEAWSGFTNEEMWIFKRPAL